MPQNYTHSDCGITRNGILNNFGWGLIAGITYNFLLQGRLVPASMSVGIFFRVLLVAASEEIVWRGYLLAAIHHITKKKSAAILLSAAGFSLCHLAGGFNPKQLIVTFLLGILWAFLRLKEDASLAFSITMHFLINIVH